MRKKSYKLTDRQFDILLKGLNDAISYNESLLDCLDESDEGIPIISKTIKDLTNLINVIEKKSGVRLSTINDMILKNNSPDFGLEDLKLKIKELTNSDETNEYICT
jgi:hypothetical protein